MENQWLTWAKQLQGIASTGLHFGKDPYDAERYEQISDIASRMLASLADAPIDSIGSLVGSHSKGYATPRIDVRGAVLRGHKVLLVKEGSDGLWTLPGGFADIGVSPSDNVVKEIWEESSLRTTIKGLYGIRHKAKHPYDQDVRDFYKLFFVCNCTDDADPLPSGVETTEAGFFTLDSLPPLSKGRVLAKDIRDAFRYQENGGRLVFCD